MDPFPTELWEGIIQNLEPRDLTVLATTCSFLQAVAESVLYHNIDLRKRSPSKIEHLHESIAACPTYGALVRRVYQQSTNPRDPTCLQPSQFPNLQELNLFDSVVDAIVLSTIFAALPRLRALYFRRPRDTRGVRRADALAPSIRADALRLLRISGYDITNQTAALLTYLTRHCCTPALTTLKIEDRIIFTAQGNRAATADYGLPKSILPFLLHTPSLRRLELQTPDPLSSHPIYKLPPSALPLLEHFAGSMNLAAIFVPGRPVYSLDLRAIGTHGNDAFRTLEGSTVPITALQIDRPGPWLQHAPQTLRHLQWGYVPKNVFLASIPSWPSMPDLTHIGGFVHRPTGTGQTIKKASQREIVMAMSAAYPSLRVCVFTADFRPEQRGFAWVRLHGGRWECRVRTVET